MVSSESGGRLSTWHVATAKLLHTVSHQDHEVHQIIIDANCMQYLTLSRSSTSNKTTCTRRLISSNDIVYQFSYEAPDGMAFYKDAVLTKDEATLVVTASFNDVVHTQTGDYRLKLYNLRTGAHQHDVLLRYANFRPFSSLVTLNSNSSLRQLIGVIDDEKGTILDVRKRSGTDRTVYSALGL